MTRYSLDTNIISNTIKPLPSDALLQWMAEQTDDSLFVSSLSLAEIWRGILAGRDFASPATSSVNHSRDNLPPLP